MNLNTYTNEVSKKGVTHNVHFYCLFSAEFSNLCFKNIGPCRFSRVFRVRYGMQTFNCVSCQIQYLALIEAGMIIEFFKFHIITVTIFTNIFHYTGLSEGQLDLSSSFG